MEVFLTVEFLTFFAAGLLGMVGHWIKRWARRQTKANLIEWLFVNNPRWALFSFVTYCGVIVGLAAVTPDLDSAQALTTAFLAGYSIDSAINNGEAPEIKD